METKNINKSLSVFAKGVIAESRTNLLGKNASRTLSKSLRYELDVHKNSFTLEMFMESYGIYQDKGVQGVNPRANKYDTPFAYSTKRPPISAFNVWSVRRGIAGRNELGQFASRKSLQFALAEHVFQFGIKPSLFFTNAFEKYFADLPEEVVKSYGLDVVKLIKSVLKTETK